MFQKLLSCFLPVYCVAFISCNKNEVSPGDAAGTPQTHIYTLTDFTYFMAEDDGIDTTTVTLPGFELRNSSNVIAERDVKVDYDDLVKKSVFIIYTPQSSLPEGIVLDKFKVKVPANWSTNGDYTLEANGFPLIAEELQMPYDHLAEDILNVKIPPASKIEVTAGIDRYNLLCSFRAVFKNQSTGTEHTVTGKWKGTLRYNNLSISVEESSLSR